MYPNPASGIVYLEISATSLEDIQLVVTDISGKIVIQRQFKDMERIVIDMSGKSSGVYFVQLTIDGNQFLRKLWVGQLT